MCRPSLAGSCVKCGVRCYLSNIGITSLDRRALELATTTRKQHFAAMPMSMYASSTFPITYQWSLTRLPKTAFV